LDRAQIWVERLDRGAEGAGRRIFVYYVENVRAEDLAAILSDVFVGDSRSETRLSRAEVAPGLTPVELGEPTSRRGQQARERTEDTEPASRQAEPAQEPERRPQAQRSGVGQAIGGLVRQSDEIRVIADDATNSLVVLATATEFRMIEATLRKLDVLPLQVLIEVTIAEVELNDTLKYGVEWFFASGNFTTTFSTLADGAVGSAFPGFSFLFDSNDKIAVLNALSEVTDIKVISSPSLMVVDNQSARLQVGDQVPVSTGATTSDTGTVTSIQQLDTGVVLEVTPRVNPGGLVRMEITQEVSTAEETTTSELDSPTINKRSIETTVAVQTGNTVTLGGLIQDTEEEGVSGVPLLSSIPILGNLFKSTQQVTNRKELLVLITPRVVRNQIEARKVTDELRKRLKGVAPLEQKIEAQPQPAS
jgi:general secretion pathway protein D